MTPAFRTLVLTLIGFALVCLAPFLVFCLVVTALICVPVYYLLLVGMNVVDRSSDDDV